MSFSAQPFKVSIPQDKLDELSAALQASRLPPPFFEGTKAEYGVTGEWMKAAKDQWQNGFDWRKLESHLNTFHHFIGTVPFQSSTFSIHYIHHKSTATSSAPAVPLILMHGWPGSFLEFLNIIEPLASLNFDVVIPSLPGFAFSDKLPLDREFGRQQVAELMDGLMRGLGYTEYAAQGGDLGSHIARILGSSFPACKAVHQNMLFLPRPDSYDDATSDLPEDEQEGLKRGDHWLVYESAYGREHGTKPSTISHVLYSSPLALLAWIGEKFISWTDETPSFTTILDSVTLWYLTDTFPHSIYMYRERADRLSWPTHIDVPYGFTWNALELAPPPLAWVAKTGNLLWSRKYSVGGHFFAMERPEAFVKDVKDCFEVLWPRREEKKEQ